MGGRKERRKRSRKDTVWRAKSTTPLDEVQLEGKSKKNTNKKGRRRIQGRGGKTKYRNIFGNELERGNRTTRGANEKRIY